VISDAQKIKAALRAEIRAKLAALPVKLRRRAAEDLCARLRQSDLWSSANSILMFAPLSDEPDLLPLLEIALAAGKQVALPRFSPQTAGYVACQVCDLEHDQRVGKFGIREPAENCPQIPTTQLDLVLVPAVAFDCRGNRIGRGKGFYDRLLADISSVKCGVVFNEQLVAEIPNEAHDVRVDWIATPSRLIKVGENRE